MKQLSFKNIGVQELDAKEMVNFLGCIIFLIILSACQKETEEIQISEYFNEYEGYFVKDLYVQDVTGTNGAYFRLYSSDETYLISFIDNHDFSIKILKDSSLNFNNNRSMIQDEMSPLKNKEFELNNFEHENPKILNIELITSNINESGTHFILEFIEKPKLKSDWVGQNYYSEVHYTHDNFVGVVPYIQAGTYWPLVEFTYKRFWYSLSYRSLKEDGETYYRTVHHYDYHQNSYGHYRVGLRMRLDKRSSLNHSQTYFIVYEKSAMVGRDCSIGTFDSRNCYVATAPAGTTAFVWPDKYGHLYHTPVNGNECPLPGSSFDSYNCHVAKIPTGSWPNDTWGFVHNNSLYVRPNRIFPI